MQRNHVGCPQQLIQFDPLQTQLLDSCSILVENDDRIRAAVENVHALARVARDAGHFDVGIALVG